MLGKTEQIPYALTHLLQSESLSSASNLDHELRRINVANCQAFGEAER